MSSSRTQIIPRHVQQQNIWSGREGLSPPNIDLPASLCQHLSLDWLSATALPAGREENFYMKPAALSIDFGFWSATPTCSMLSYSASVRPSASKTDVLKSSSLVAGLPRSQKLWYRTHRSYIHLKRRITAG